MAAFSIPQMENGWKMENGNAHHMGHRRYIGKHYGVYGEP
jgi:hypothetical protein